MECLGRYTFLVMTSVILSGGTKIRAEHGMLRGVYISGHDFLSYFQVEGVRGTSMECLGEYTFLVMTSVILSSGIKMRHMATDDRRQTTDDRGQTTDDRRQTSENRPQKTDNKRKTANGRGQTTDDRR